MHKPINNIVKHYQKLGIESLNEMQEQVLSLSEKAQNTYLVAPTGSGKTLAFLLPMLRELDLEKDYTQALIMVPTRELAMQVEQVLREMGTGFKVQAVYGGRSASSDRLLLEKSTPQVLIATPGRLIDHLESEHVMLRQIRFLIFDEFDKILSFGFSEQLRQIMPFIPASRKCILCSATEAIEIPESINFFNYKELRMKGETEAQLEVVGISTQDPRKSLHELLVDLSGKHGIIFCNFRESVSSIASYLEEQGHHTKVLYGTMEQIDRERSLLQFRNKSTLLLVATDLAARGLDIPQLDFIIHYELPSKEDAYIHRNGRTARMHDDGKAYVIYGNRAPEYIRFGSDYKPNGKGSIKEPSHSTVVFTAGRKDKISKGDILGFVSKQGGLSAKDVGRIELGVYHSYAAISRAKAYSAIEKLNNQKLKTKKVRVYELD